MFLSEGWGEAPNRWVWCTAPHRDDVVGKKVAGERFHTTQRGDAPKTKTSGSIALKQFLDAKPKPLPIKQPGAPSGLFEPLPPSPFENPCSASVSSASGAGGVKDLESGAGLASLRV